jgi:hypothetical protein
VSGLPLLIACALVSSASAAQAQPADQAAASTAPTGLTVAASIAAGGETGLSSGKSGLLELELATGWEFPSTRLRPEVAVALGLSPATSFSVRTGLRAGLNDVPVWLRAAIDFSSARSRGTHARWILFGAAWQLQLNTQLALDVGLDFGVPLSSSAGVPIMLRGGGTFRL